MSFFLGVDDVFMTSYRIKAQRSTSFTGAVLGLADSNDFSAPRPYSDRGGFSWACDSNALAVYAFNPGAIGLEKKPCAGSRDDSTILASVWV